MKKLSIILNTNASTILLISIAVMALGFCHLDAGRKMADRHTYAEFIKESAMPFKDLKMPQESDKDKFDAPDLASLQEFFMTMDPVQKRVTAERLPNAYRQLLQMQSKQYKPGGYELEWTGTETEIGGRTRAIMWDPLVNNKVWAGSVTGGLWYNNDVTSWGEWNPVNDMWDNLVISCITYDPNDPLTMYVGTGEAQTALITYRESGGRGVGIWKTTDGGQNWTLIPSTSPFAYVTKIAVRNENGSSVVYAGVVSGYYHGLQQSEPTDGLYRSTDGGGTWEQVLPLIAGDIVPYAPNNVSLGADGRIYVGTMQNTSGNGGGVILYSDNGTAGTWTKFEDVAALIQTNPVSPLPGRVELATSASDADVIYAAFAAGIHSPGTQPVYKGAYIYRSDDKGVTWNPVNLPGGSSEWANLAWHAMVIAVDPNDPNTVYAGGLDEWRTTDGGTTWNHLTDWALMYYGGGIKYIHADQHAIVYQPGSSKKILYGSDGGVFYTDNGNATQPVFEQQNRNYNTLQFYSGAIHPGAGQNKFIGGLQDNGSLLYQGNPLSIYSMISGGDGAYCFWDKETPLVYITSLYYNMYYMFNNSTLVNQDGYYESGVFVNPVDYYSSENTLYANATDFLGGMADSILVIDNIPISTNVYFINAGTGTDSYFSQVKVSPFSIGSSPSLFLGTVSGKLFKVTDVLSDPVTTDIGSPEFPTGNISSIAVGGSEDTLLVTFSNYGVSSIWQTYNGGQSWNEVEGNLPDMPVRWAIYHPQNSKQVLIATELGVWSTNDVQDTTVVWTPQNAGMANIRVDMLTLRTSDNTVLAATHGRGLFTCKFYLDNPKSTPDLTKETSPFIIFKSESGIEIKSTTKQSAEYAIYSMGGSEVLKGRLEAGIVNHIVNVKQLSHGVYLVKVQSGDTKLVKKVVF
jgi:photosystem II stability/assembly factor-like uncharacterized protein